jgi:hypothetical protein
MALTRLNGINAITGTIPQGNIANASLGAVTALPTGLGGKVLQVVSTTTTAVSSINSDSDTLTDIPNLNVSITPSSTSSKIFLTGSVFYGIDNDTYGSLGGISFFRGTTQIGDGSSDIASGTVVGIGYTGTNNHVTVPIQFLDSPSTTSATTYKIRCKNLVGGTVTFVVNGRRNGTQRGSSTLTAFEIAG